MDIKWWLQIKLLNSKRRNKSEVSTILPADTTPFVKMSRNQKKLICLILLLILDINSSKAVPHRWYGSPDTALTNSSFNSYQKMRNSDHYYSQRKILSKGNFASNLDDTASRSDGKIIFPSDDMDSQTQKYTIPVKPTCEHSTYCENVENYPNHIVEAVLRQNKNFNILSGIDLVPDVVQRVNVPQEYTSLCESQEKLVYPKIAENKDKEWRFIVNHENFTQGVRVETCGQEDSECNLIDGIADGYKTVCKQKYIYRQLVALTKTNDFKPEMFRFPASCCCHIKFLGSPLPRIGISPKKTELPTSPKD